jgi:hypothetical protein
VGSTLVAGAGLFAAGATFASEPGPPPTRNSTAPGGPTQKDPAQKDPAQGKGTPDRQTYPTGPDGVYEQLAVVHQFTAKYRDPERAIADGYQPAASCVATPKGTMGYHYSRWDAVDDELDIRYPEILVYYPTEQGLRLGAVEYMQRDADQDLQTADDRPSLFGEPFDGPMAPHEPWQPKHYDMHVWLWKYNPSGLFAQYNPSIKCPAKASDTTAPDARAPAGTSGSGPAHTDH